jgi:hypothetical protein
MYNHKRPKTYIMKREDFKVNGTTFRLTHDQWHTYKVDYSLYTSVVNGNEQELISIKAINRAGIVLEEMMFVEFVKGGVKFWSVMGGIYGNSRLYKFNEFELISTPITELSAQGA